MPRDLDEHRRIAALARAAGAEVAIDIEAAVAPTCDHLEALLGSADIVFMNEGGFRATSDAPITAEALRPMLAFGPRVVAVTLGARGAVAVTGEDLGGSAGLPGGNARRYRRRRLLQRRLPCRRPPW